MPPMNRLEDFQRDVSYRILKKDDGTIALTATLRDPYHDIVVEVVVDADTLTISTATVDFRKSPNQECRNVAPRLERLVGFPIGQGLNRKLAETFGGGEGCGNLRNLFLGLLPLAINVKAAAGFTDEQEMLAGIHEKLVGTCAGYVPDDETSMKEP